MTPKRLPTYFLSHGGGPWPWMKDFRPGAYDQRWPRRFVRCLSVGDCHRASIRSAASITFTLMHTMYPAADTWLNTTLVNSSPDERQQRLLRWQVAPAARLAHPREDHLIPLMVAVGAAGNDAGVRVYHQTDFMDSITASSYRFGAPVIAGGR